MIRLEVMRSFVAVYDDGSVVGAARTQGYSPAAVSRQIATLQRSLGVVLFEPDGRGIRPTDNAGDLAPLVRDVLAHVDRLEGYLRDVRQRRGHVAYPGGEEQDPDSR